MFIDVNKIPPAGLEIDRALSLPPLPEGSGETVRVESARLLGSLRKTASDVEFRGKVQAVVSLTCSRCLAPFRLSLEAPCHRIFRPGPLGRPESEHELVEEDVALTPFDGVRIDLGEMALEQIVLAVPLKPLCQPLCRGICPRCGADRNTQPCDCPEEPRESIPLTSKITL